MKSLLKYVLLGFYYIIYVINCDTPSDYDSEIDINQEKNKTNDLLSINSTETTTKSLLSIKCRLMNTTSDEENRVILVNGSTLSQKLSSSLEDHCFLIMFYLPSCHFSAKLAPNYNALPRAFKSLDVFAMNLAKSHGYSTKFGASAVPLVILFQHTNVLARFNHTHKNLTDLIDFIEKNTGLSGNKSIVIEAKDFEGPVPTVPIKTFDYFLFFSWCFIIFGFAKFLIYKYDLINLGKNFIFKFRVAHEHHE